MYIKHYLHLVFSGHKRGPTKWHYLLKIRILNVPLKTVP